MKNQACMNCHPIEWAIDALLVIGGTPRRISRGPLLPLCRVLGKKWYGSPLAIFFEGEGRAIQLWHGRQRQDFIFRPLIITCPMPHFRSCVVFNFQPCSPSSATRLPEKKIVEIKTVNAHLAAASVEKTTKRQPPSQRRLGLGSSSRLFDQTIGF